MKEYMCDVTLVFSGNNHQAKNVEEYKQKVIEQFNNQYPNINITEDEISFIEETDNNSSEPLPTNTIIKESCLLRTFIKEICLSDVPIPNDLWWHSDSGHSWLRVPVAFVMAVGFEPSSYSYIDDGFVYLEEDSDAPKFIKLIGRYENLDEPYRGVIITRDNHEIKVIEVDDGIDSPIREYARCPSLSLR